jgi:hypothetical protein
MGIEAFSLKTGDLRPGISTTVYDESGNVVDLTGCAVNFAWQQQGGPSFTKAATILSPASNGQVVYNWATGDTTTAGKYLCEFQITDGSGNKSSYPHGVRIPLEITSMLPVSIPTGVTLLQDFYDPVRAFLGDFDTEEPLFKDRDILSVLRALVLSGQMPSPYALDATRTQITPAITRSHIFGRLVHRAVRALLLPDAHGQFVRTRQLSQRQETKGLCKNKFRF